MTTHRLSALCVLSALVLATPAHAQLTVLHRFTGGVDGARPNAGVVEVNGALVGTTWSSSERGTFFDLEPNGAYYTAYIPAVVSSNNPQGLAVAVDGTVFGVTTGLGGVYGMGQIYRADGALTTVHTFTGGLDGAYPISTLVTGPNSYLYGAATGGGAFNAGVVFRMALAGVLEPLHAFAGGLEGQAPMALVAAADGSLVGLAQRGGAFGAGLLFRLQPDGRQFAVLAHFPIGLGPASLIQGSDSFLYGTTLPTAQHGGCLFRASLAGSVTILHCLSLGIEGQAAGQLLELGGMLYGASQEGGIFGGGTLFRTSLDGRVTTVLWSFDHGVDGWSPRSPLTVSADGSLVGTTRDGGLECLEQRGCGVVFRYTLPSEEADAAPGFLVN